MWNATDDADSYVRASALYVIGSLTCQSQLWVSLLQTGHVNEVFSYFYTGLHVRRKDKDKRKHKLKKPTGSVNGCVCKDKPAYVCAYACVLPGLHVHRHDTILNKLKYRKLELSLFLQYLY